MSRVGHEQQRGAKPLLLLIGSSAQVNREFILRSVTAGHRLWLMQPADVTWQAPYVVGGTVVDNTDAAALVAAARHVASEHEVDGVLCYDEGLVWPAAAVTEALGLPGNPPGSVAACRDKHATRRALADAGVFQPASVGTTSAREALAAADRVGYPVVLKPRGLAGSMGVLRADDATAVAGAYGVARAAAYPGVPEFEMGVLVEEFVDGPEISVDAVFYEGRCTPLVVAHKRVDFSPYFEEVGHVVDGADPLLGDPALHDALERSHKALGYRNGVTHTEFRLTERGPCLLEVNARLGGGMIPYLGQLATGVDVALAAADVAAGRCPATRPDRRRAAAIRFLYPEADVEVDHVSVREERVTGAIHSAAALVGPGTVLRLPPRGYISRYGRVIALAETLAETEAALADAHEVVHLAARPAPQVVTR
jgi:biotin carboxylase